MWSRHASLRLTRTAEADVPTCLKYLPYTLANNYSEFQSLQIISEGSSQIFPLEGELYCGFEEP
jgi:hypothetical protein